MSTALIWFRNDLRCHDNPALTSACEHHERIIPLYIKEKNPKLLLGGAQKWWLFHSLNALKKSLKNLKLDLYLREADPLALLKELIAEYHVDVVYWNRRYEPMYIEFDQQIKSELKHLGVKVISSNGSLLNEPWEIMNQSGSYFKVFTPYWKHCLKHMRVYHAKKSTHVPSLQVIPTDSLKSWHLLPTLDWAKEFSECWLPGEEGAAIKLEEFIKESLNDYKEARNIPSLWGTSRLSPHLHFGEISPQQIWISVQHAMQQAGCNLASAQTYLSELGWREFSYYLLYHFPSLIDSPFNEKFAAFTWSQSKSALSFWQQGLTGYPIVDAGMRELWRTGYMHNRVRMIVASFLTKDLLIHWREGAAWFWDTLVDADLANNSASWQWVAGSGADAAPYYRIFNPVLQGETFDPEGEYVKHWVPELKKVDKKWVHKPWEAPKEALAITLGKEYPYPLVNHSQAREEALMLYKELKNTM